MDEKRIENAMRFYLLANTLKYKIRSGWDNIHWNVSSERLESIAEHIYGTCILAIGLDSEFKYEIDINKVIKMLVIHELEEVIIGDITPFDNVTKEQKIEEGHKAILTVIGELVKKEELINLILEFDSKKTKEALFAYHCDKLEADIQAKIYDDKGFMKWEDQVNNIVLRRKSIQQIIDFGAETIADVWHEYDKILYEDDEVFAKTLVYVNKHKIAE